MLYETKLSLTDAQEGFLRAKNGRQNVVFERYHKDTIFHTRKFMPASVHADLHKGATSNGTT